MSPFTVLVVEDHVPSAELLRILLEIEQCRCVWAASILQVPDRLAGCRPDVVLTDMRLPDGSGVGLMAMIRARPGLEGVPVYVMTAEDEASARPRLLARGFDGFIAKPLELPALRALLRRLRSTPAAL